MDLRALLLASTLHTVVAAALVASCAGSIEQTPPHEKTVQPVTQVVFLPSPSETGTGAPCASSYNGFGYMANFGSGVVWAVAPGSPAEAAFIMVGDVIVNNDSFAPDTLPVGTDAVLIVSRNGVITNRHLKVGVVCTSQGQP